jgi:dTDP-4-dehydrorhamnose reductase
MKILVLGSKGQLGSCLSDQLIKTAYDVIYLSRADFDISNLDSLSKNISLLKPNILINASAYTDVDKAEEDNQAANLVNHLAVGELANICKDLNSWLIHISTDYVFDGSAVMPYSEGNETNPKSIYGESKLNGELAITASGCKYFIIRTAWVFSEYGNNFLKTMLTLGAKYKELRIVDDQIGCPTYAQDIAKAIVSMLPNIAFQTQVSGIFHYCGNQPCSWYDFASSIFLEAKARGYKVPTILKKVNSVEFKSIAPRPSYSVLDCSKIKAEFDINPSDWIDGISSSIEALNLNTS